MNINKGVIEVFGHQVLFSLIGDLEIDSTPSCIWLTGKNGAGKTSFIEGVLIPALQKERIPFIYFGQDFQTQYYTIQAVLAVEGNRVDPADFAGTVNMWINRSPEAKILILDEFDKYWNDMKRLYASTRGFVKTYIVVTHDGASGDNGPGAPFTNRIWSFEEKGLEGASPVVEVREVRI